MGHVQIEWLTVEWRTSEMNGSLSYWMADSWMAYHRIEWITVLPYWMAYHRIGWITVLNGVSPNWMDHCMIQSCFPFQDVCWINLNMLCYVMNGSPYWMDYRIEWITVNWMAHRELNSGLRLRNLGTTKVFARFKPGKHGDQNSWFGCWRRSRSAKEKLKRAVNRSRYSEHVLKVYWLQ